MNMNPYLPGMFPEIGSSNDKQGMEAKSMTFYFLTNRNNLQEILSSGMIRPSSWVKKYYPDLRQFCPNHIPLLISYPTPELVASSSDEASFNFPVLAELDLTVVDGDGWLIKDDYFVEKVRLPTTQSGICLVVSAAIPLDRISLLEFRTLKELRESQINQYSNIPDEKIPLQMFPDHFESTSIDSEHLLSVLRDLNSQLPPVDSHLSEAIDSLGGVFLLYGRLAKKDPTFPLRVLTRVLAPFLESYQGEQSDLSPARFPVGYSWNQAVLSLLPPGLPLHQSPESIFNQLTGSGVSEGTALETFLFAVALEHLSAIHFQEFASDQALQEIVSDFIERLPALNLKSVNGVGAAYRRIVNQISDVSIGVLDLDEYLQIYPIESYPASSALLLLTLGSKPEQVLRRYESGEFYRPETLAMLAALSGSLYGRSMVVDENQPPVSYRRFIDRTLARYANKASGGLVLETVYDDLEIQIETTETGKVEILLQNNAELFRRSTSLFKSRAQVPGTPQLALSALPYTDPSRKEKTQEGDSTGKSVSRKATVRKGRPAGKVMPPESETQAEVGTISEDLAEQTVSKGPESHTLEKTETRQQFITKGVPEVSAHGEPDAVKSKQEGPEGPDQQSFNPAVTRRRLIQFASSPETSESYRLLVNFCIRAEMMDLLTTVIQLEGQEFILQKAKGRHELRIQGYHKPVYRLAKPEELKSRLEKLSDQTLRKALTPEMEKLIGLV